jgi:hypothetical protein
VKALEGNGLPAGESQSTQSGGSAENPTKPQP